MFAALKMLKQDHLLLEMRSLCTQHAQHANGISGFALQIPWDFGLRVCFDEHATKWLAVVYQG